MPSTALEDHLTCPIGQLSKGFRQRVGLAQTILHTPALLIRDEPTAGLNPTQMAQVRHPIRRLAERSSLLRSMLSKVVAGSETMVLASSQNNPMPTRGLNRQIAADDTSVWLSFSRYQSKDVPPHSNLAINLGLFRNCDTVSEGYSLC